MKLLEAYQQFIEWRGLKRKSRTINGDVTHLAHFCLYMRDPEMNVEDISLEHCMAWLVLFRRLNFDENTVQKKAIALKLLFDFLKDRDVKVFNPDLIPIPRKTFKFPRVATEEEYRKLLAVIPDHGTGSDFKGYTHVRNKAIITLLWESGARNGEIASLRLEDIDLNRMSARIKTEKSRGTVPYREIFWREEANQALAGWLVKREELAQEIPLADPKILFFGIKGGHKNCPGKGKILQVNFISEILRKYSNKAGLAIPLNPHSCRHHFGRELARKDTNAYGIASLLGHANIQSSFIYTQLFGNDREELYRNKMDQKEVKPPVPGNGNGHANGHANGNGNANGHAKPPGNGIVYIAKNGHANGKL